MTRILTSNFQAPIEVISSFQYKVRRDFDSDVSLDNPVNVEAARQRGWVYDFRRGAYVDEDGCLMADEFGQEF